MTKHDYCPVCGCSLEWEDCQSCWGMGVLDEYDDDSINCRPGTLYTCPECDGAGGWPICSNIQNHRVVDKREAA